MIYKLQQRKIIAKCTSCNGTGCLNLCKNVYFCEGCRNWFTLWEFDSGKILCLTCVKKEINAVS